MLVCHTAIYREAVFTVFTIRVATITTISLKSAVTHSNFAFQVHHTPVICALDEQDSYVRASLVNNRLTETGKGPSIIVNIFFCDNSYRDSLTHYPQVTINCLSNLWRKVKSLFMEKAFNLELSYGFNFLFYSTILYIRIRQFCTICAMLVFRCNSVEPIKMKFVAPMPEQVATTTMQFIKIPGKLCWHASPCMHCFGPNLFWHGCSPRASPGVQLDAGVR